MSDKTNCEHPTVRNIPPTTATGWYRQPTEKVECVSCETQMPRAYWEGLRAEEDE